VLQTTKNRNWAGSHICGVYGIMDIKIVIPSHKRPDKVIAKRAVLDAIICVPEAHESEYKESNPEHEIVTHPNDVVGLALKRQWIYEHFGNVFMIDDDVTAMYRTYLPPINKNELVEYGCFIDPKTAKLIIQRTAEMTKEIGAYLFGFQFGADMRNFTSLKPFRLTGYVTGCAMGLLKGSKLYFVKEAELVEDYWVSLLNAFHHRYIFVDERYGFKQRKTFKNIGGLAKFRNVEKEKQATEFLRKYFGSAIRPKKRTRGKKSHPYERIMSLPF